MRNSIRTRGSGIAEGPRVVLCQLKCCQLMHKFKLPIFTGSEDMKGTYFSKWVTLIWPRLFVILRLIVAMTYLNILDTKTPASSLPTIWRKTKIQIKGLESLKIPFLFTFRKNVPNLYRFQDIARCLSEFAIFSDHTCIWLSFALTRGRTDHFVTYLQFPVTVCFSTAETELFFAVSLSPEKEHSRVILNFDYDLDQWNLQS